MTTGPAPMPTALRVLHGGRSAAGDRINKAEPVAPRGKPEAPKFILEHPEAKVVWDEVVGWLAEMRLETPADRDSLAVYVMAVVQHREAERTLQDEGYYTTGSTGQMVKHPATVLVAEAAKRIAVFGAKFGLTPSDRSRVVAPSGEGEESNPFG